MKLLTCLVASCVLLASSALEEETTTPMDEETDTPTPTSLPENEKQNGTNRILNYGAAGGNSFGLFAGNSFTSVAGQYHPGASSQYYPHPAVPKPPTPGNSTLLTYSFHTTANMLTLMASSLATAGVNTTAPGGCLTKSTAVTTPILPGQRCPQMRYECPSTYYRHLNIRRCSGQQDCTFGEFCCPDVCLGYHVCKPS